MRALTCKQPWASLIASGRKTIENRTWAPPAALIGQRIAIHAGAGWDKNGETHGVAREECPASRVVCTAVIDRVVTTSDDPFWIGPVGWVLRDIEPCDGPEIKGKLGLWHLPSSSSHSVPATTTAPSAY